MNLTQYETDSLETFYNFVNLKNKSNENLKKIRVCLYLRKSQEDEKDNSLNLQKTEIDKFICKLNTEFKDKYQFFYDENDVFAEDNRSGIATSHREEFNRMIDFINDNPGYYGMCLVFKLDRFSRNTEDTAHFTRILREKYCLLKALNFEDQGTPESKLFLTMMSAVSQFHAQNSAKLSIDGTKQKVLQHKCVGALPFGLTTSKQQNNTNEVGASNIVIDEQKSKIVKEIFTKYSEGMSLTDLTEYLEKRGYRNNNGNYFSRHQLYNMLRNKRYNGTYIYADKSRKRKRKYDNGVVKPKYYEKNNAIPKIIDDDLFNMVQMIIKSKENSRDVSTSISSYLLSGRLVCKCCGSKLVGDSGTSGRNHTKYRYYTCPNYKSKKNKIDGIKYF